MGSSASKAARTAGNAAKRQYPTRIPPLSATQQPASSGPTVHPPPQASSEKTQAIASDAFDPQLAASLRALGPVTPSPTQSNSSTFAPQPASFPSASSLQMSSSSSSSPSAPVFPSPSSNPALQILRAREELAERAEREFEALGRKGFAGREFLDVMQIRQVLMMRDQRGMGADEIEGRLGLRPGVVSRLGSGRIVQEVGDAGQYGSEKGGGGPLG